MSYPEANRGLIAVILIITDGGVKGYMKYSSNEPSNDHITVWERSRINEHHGV